MGYAYLDASTCPSNGDFGGFNLETATIDVATDTVMVNPFVIGPIGNCGSNPVTTRTVTPNPALVAVNSVTHKAYAAWPCDNQVVVNDLAMQSESYLPTPGKYPIAVAVNSTTNKTYLANRDSNNVTVIDNNTNSMSTLADPKAVSPMGVAVNPNTDRIYVTNAGSNNVTVIDGATNSVITTIAVGTSPMAVDVNPATNFIYVANFGTHSGNAGSITIINGETNSTTELSDNKAINPVAVAVNSATNKIYVANSASSNVTVLNGAH